jgi:hypothetical protein
MMAHENESFPETSTRVINKLLPACEHLKGDRNCFQQELEFEDRCRFCQASGLLSFCRDEIPALMSRAREVDRLQQFKLNSLGGYG